MACVTSCGVGNAGAPEIDRGVERVAAEGLAVAPVIAARELDHDFADADDTGVFVAHGTPNKHDSETLSAGGP